MTAVAYMVDKIVRGKRGRDMRETWRNAAAYIGIAPGTVENIQRERIKFVDRFENKVRAAEVALGKTIEQAREVISRK